MAIENGSSGGIEGGRIALVVGATGGIGGAVATTLIAHGWQVRAVARDPAAASRRAAGIGAVEWVAGDAMQPATIAAAAKGVRLIVHAVNPPGYRNWARLVLPMLESSIAAAKASGARVVLPGTIYNFGPGAFPVLREDSPQNPVTRKGRIRVAMEERLQQAAREGVHSLIVRAGDFFGSDAGSSWLSAVMIKPGKPLTAVTYPGRREVGHSWAYLPDLGETIARLADREADLEPFARFHFRGHWFERGVAMAEAVRTAAGKPDIPIKRFPWIAVYLGAPFVILFREMLEMTYLWREPLVLDNARLVAFLGEEPHTPLDMALKTTLKSAGVLS